MSALNLIGRYFKRLFVTLDILLNVIFFGEVETISSRCGKRLAPMPVKPCRVCGVLCKVIESSLNGRWTGHCINNRRDPYK